MLLTTTLGIQRTTGTLQVSVQLLCMCLCPEGGFHLSAGSSLPRQLGCTWGSLGPSASARLHRRLELHQGAPGRLQHDHGLHALQIKPSLLMAVERQIEFSRLVLRMTGVGLDEMCETRNIGGQGHLLVGSTKCLMLPSRNPVTTPPPLHP